MKRQPFVRVAATLALLYAGAPFHCENANAQVLDFGKIDAFESMGTGTQRGGSPPKTIVDDSDQHTVFFTILESTPPVRSTDRSVAFRVSRRMGISRNQGRE
jgi:hypothetical protein